MDIYVHPCNKKNIGDELNHWFWPELMGDALHTHHGSLLVGIGTVLNDKLPKDRDIHVMGSGAGYGELTHHSQWNIHFVRGFLTAKAIGVDKAKVASDPGLLISKLRPQDSGKKHKLSFMPHVNIDSPRYRDFIHSLGWHYISPSDEESVVLADIAATEKLITSAMHGAILADAYRTPWLPISTSPEILNFKWQDWFSSVDITAELDVMPPIWPEPPPTLAAKAKDKLKAKVVRHKLEQLAQRGAFQLSKESTLEQKQAQIAAEIEKAKHLLLSREVCK